MRGVHDLHEPCPRCSRRDLLRAGLGFSAAAIAAGVPAGTLAADGAPATSQLPKPIPQLDPRGHHNVPPAPYSEPSEIFNFKGRVATAVLSGTGRDHAGKPLKFGGPGTDVRFMQGEFVTEGGARQRGTLTHL
ncbi:hypothetical protein [Nitrolancea hollandica]|uniref:Uncharacterized protein n=1 Tax=Nitrolancea hollandica Lb TaxID=1129897 RepID=I4EGS6_9BACT|nr:hypothetical protein [Nitrolancea hollandica]CCF83888.1 exported hypothetical protein [Nitrolancea hollandica Lb]